MTWWQQENFAKKKAALDLRQKVIRAVRKYFEDQDFAEVETPALQVMPCADIHIHGFQTGYFGPDLKHERDYYLHTSPEFDMKKLLVAGVPRLYQICKVFRNAERTRLHAPEFTMLEWYRRGMDYTDIMHDCEKLLCAVSKATGISAIKDCYLMHEFERLSVTTAFRNYAGIDLIDCLDDIATFTKAATAQGVRVAPGDDWSDIFHAVMAEKIEPFLGTHAPTILYDYPSSMACLAKKAFDQRFAERFELYINGVELANAFSELTDATEQRKRFQHEMADKQERYGFSYPLDEDFLSALEYGMPEAGGIALGLDRLVMLLVGANSIDDVLWTKKP